jgi:hypothetical protein
MKLDGDKLLDKLYKARKNHIKEKNKAESDSQDEFIHFCAECTLDNVIDEIMSGNYTIKDDK